jgi:hypothetical protein
MERIHSVRVTRDAGESINILNDEAREQSGRVTSVTLVAEQQYGIKVYEDEAGFAFIRFGEGGHETDPVLVSDLVQQLPRDSSPPAREAAWTLCVGVPRG